MHLDRMETKNRENCASCGKVAGITTCDKCSLSTCRECLVIMSNTKNKSLISVLHYKCAPLSHRKKVDESRGEVK